MDNDSSSTRCAAPYTCYQTAIHWEGRRGSAGDQEGGKHLQGLMLHPFKGHPQSNTTNTRVRQCSSFCDSRMLGQEGEGNVVQGGDR
jgi:hypothetical protein